VWESRASSLRNGTQPPQTIASISTVKWAPNVLRLAYRLTESIKGRNPGCSDGCSLLVCLGIRDRLSATWQPASEGLEVVSWPLAAASSVVAETAAGVARVSPSAVYYRGPISPAKRTRLASTLMGSWGAQLAHVCRSRWANRRGHFASAIACRYRTDQPSDSAGYPMAMPALSVA